MPKQTLSILDETFAIHSFPPLETIPEIIHQVPIYFIGKTYDELSIICPENIILNSQESDTGWGCLEVLGPLGFSVTEILSEVTKVLAKAKINIIALSTFDADYLLIKQEAMAVAIDSLKQSNYDVLNTLEYDKQ